MPKDIIYDFDIWYRPTLSNFDKLTDALSNIQPDNRSELKSIVFHPERCYIRITEKPFKIELLPQIAGYVRQDYSQVKERAISFRLNKHEAPVISYEDLIQTKKSLGRDIDKNDIRGLENAKKKEKNKGF
ncbi:hypothetical protein JMN32_03600 [Fulvivirga sp. 29W222]|uniref:Uncharacterized protein n=1 Tax=Fulvivirga marina TaxID=2494733 RepID=A0A937FYQ6_9BACT|nr:hypothetical protein [Fulvivirga marina]MBL6445376.1 hypothetical protein [Fulvivirga marina]